MTAALPDPDDQPPSKALARTATEQWLAAQTGVEAALNDQGLAVWSIPESLSTKVHLTIPTSQIVQLDANVRPLLRTVKLKHDVHTYNEKGKPALKASALHLLANASGIHWLPPVIKHLDIPGGGVEITARAEWRGPDGTMQPAADTKIARFAHLERKGRRERLKKLQSQIGYKSDTGDHARRVLADPDLLEDELAKYVDDELEHIDAKTETKAKARVVRHWLAISSTYKPEDFQKPFLCLAWVLTPDYSDPNVLAVIDSLAGRSQRKLYPVPDTTARRALPPAHDNVVDEPPDDDDAGPDSWDEHGQVVDVEAITVTQDDDVSFDDDAEPAKPPRPEKNPKLSAGSYKGLTFEETVNSVGGFIWFAEKVASIADADLQQLMLAWLSFSEGRPLKLEECKALAREKFRQMESDQGAPE